VYLYKPTKASCGMYHIIIRNNVNNMALVILNRKGFL
jgi:hypothetical protein